MNKTKKIISDDIGSLPDEFRQSIKHLDQIISAVMVGHSRALWEGALWGGTEQAIIGHGSYKAFLRNKIIHVRRLRCSASERR